MFDLAPAAPALNESEAKFIAMGRVVDGVRDYDWTRSLGETQGRARSKSLSADSLQ